MSNDLKELIENLWENRETENFSNKIIKDKIKEALSLLDNGTQRVAQKDGKDWKINEWLKKTILLSFKIKDSSIFSSGISNSRGGQYSWYDKVDLKTSGWVEDEWTKRNFRSVPGAIVRYSAHISENVVLMPSFVNLGAFVDSGTMIDTWATVGSCAQIGKNVHISGGVGIGGVLEPLQAEPVIIEDGCFIGSRCIVVEGVKVCKEAVLGAGVTLTKSTKIIDVTQKKEVIYKGIVPERSVVIPGTYKKEFNRGKFSVQCALIIGKRKNSTNKKTSLNQALREFEIST